MGLLFLSANPLFVFTDLCIRRVISQGICSRSNTGGRSGGRGGIVAGK